MRIRSIIFVVLVIAFAACTANVAKPTGARLTVHPEWPPPDHAQPVEIQLTEAEWLSIEPLVPDLNGVERKTWTNLRPRLGLDLLDGDGKTIADGYFRDPTSLRLTFQDGKTGFYDVSPKLEEELIAIARRRGLWK